MVSDFSSMELQLINQYHILTPENKKELSNYIKYLILKQYQAELHKQILTNPVLHNGLVQAARMCEREDTKVEEIIQKVNQVKYTFYHLIENIYLKYADYLGDAMLYDYLHDWGTMGFVGIIEAGYSNNKKNIRQQLEEMLQGYKNLAKNSDKRQIIAV